jgi:hypothetical protein
LHQSQTSDAAGRAASIADFVSLDIETIHGLARARAGRRKD